MWAPVFKGQMWATQSSENGVLLWSKCMLLPSSPYIRSQYSVDSQSIWHCAAEAQDRRGIHQAPERAWLGTGAPGICASSDCPRAHPAGR